MGSFLSLLSASSSQDSGVIQRSNAYIYATQYQQSKAESYKNVLHLVDGPCVQQEKFIQCKNSLHGQQKCSTN